MRMANHSYKNLLPGRFILILIAFVLFYGCGAKRYGMEHVDPDTFESLKEMGAYYDWWLNNLKDVRAEDLKKVQEELDKELTEAGKTAKKKSKQILNRREKVLADFGENVQGWKMNRAVRKKLIELGMENLKKDYDNQIMKHDNKLKQGIDGEAERIRKNYETQYFAEEAEMNSRLEKARNLIYDQKDRIASKGETTMLNAQIQIQKRDIAQVERETGTLQNEIKSYYDNSVSGIGWKEIGDILHSEGLKSPMGKRLKSNNVHSIYKKGKLREKRLNSKPKVTKRMLVYEFREDGVVRVI